MDLIAGGADPVCAIEPNPVLADRLRGAVRGSRATIEVMETAFEDTQLPQNYFDLAVAATSFHWISPAPGLARVREVLRPGGAWAMWWNVFGDPERADPFHHATHRLLEPLHRSPSAGENGRPPFALDVEKRTAELTWSGLSEVEHRITRWPLVLDPDGVRSLYATFSPVSRLPESERRALLDTLAGVAATQFAGRVERNMVMIVYSAHKPEDM